MPPRGLVLSLHEMSSITPDQRPRFDRDDPIRVWS